MMDSGAAPRSYETVPVAVGRGGGRGPLVATALVAVFVALAIVKPWGDGSGPASDASGASAAPAVPGEATAAVTVPSAAPTAPVAEAVALPAQPGPTAVPPASGPSGPMTALPFGGPRTMHPPTGGARTPSDPLYGPLVARLAAHSGAWGIGSGGWGISPVSGEPWAGWESVAPVPSEEGPSHRVAPTCEGLAWLRVGIIVAVTAPPDLPPDWTISAQRFDTSGGPLDPFIARQVSAAGSSGVSYLVRPDDSQWRSGAYRFTVTTPTSSLILDACLIAL